jgi:hypothetical protein
MDGGCVRQHEFDHANINAQSYRVGALISAITSKLDQSLAIESRNLALFELSLQKSEHFCFGSERRLTDSGHIFNVEIEQFAKRLDLGDT